MDCLVQGRWLKTVLHTVLLNPSTQQLCDAGCQPLTAAVSVDSSSEVLLAAVPFVACEVSSQPIAAGVQ